MTHETQNTRQAGGEGGFTLVELMVAMVVLTVGLFSIIQLQVVTVRGHAYARERGAATLIAMQAAEEMRVQVKKWVELRGGVIVGLEDALPQVAGQLVETPPAGAQLNFSDLRALQTYGGQTIASGPAVANAYRINPRGFSPDSGTATEEEGMGAIYRVHYAAYYEDLGDPVLANTLLRVLLVVSWDSKDSGEGYDWTQWATEANFWKRHLVAFNFYLPRTRRH